MKIWPVPQASEDVELVVPQILQILQRLKYLCSILIAIRGICCTDSSIVKLAAWLAAVRFHQGEQQSSNRLYASALQMGSDLSSCLRCLSAVSATPIGHITWFEGLPSSSKLHVTPTALLWLCTHRCCRQLTCTINFYMLISFCATELVVHERSTEAAIGCPLG